MKRMNKAQFKQYLNNINAKENIEFIITAKKDIRPFKWLTKVVLETFANLDRQCIMVDYPAVIIEAKGRRDTFVLVERDRYNVEACTSHLFPGICHKLVIDRFETTPYTDAMVEDLFNRRLITMTQFLKLTNGIGQLNHISREMEQDIDELFE